jgi:hypothetical protein
VRISACNLLDGAVNFSFQMIIHYVNKDDRNNMEKIMSHFRYTYITILLLLVAQSTYAFNFRLALRERTMKGHKPQLSYSAARRYMFTEIHMRRDQRGTYYVRDVYCHKIVYINKRSIPNHTVMNTEHTWPRSRFNPRENFHIQEADLHHLYPTDSKANSIRGNYLFTEFNGKAPLSSCPTSSFGYDHTGRRGFEPPPHHRGNVARALFYFSIRYNIRIAPQEERIIRKWHALDPVDEMEVRRNNLVQKAQGNRNPFIDDPRLVAQIEDF